MALNKLENAAYLDQDWQDEIKSKNLMKLALSKLLWEQVGDHWQLNSGTGFDVDGVIYKLDGNLILPATPYDPTEKAANKFYIINKNVGASTSISLHDGDTIGIADTIFETSIIQFGNTVQPEITEIEVLIDNNNNSYDWDGCGFKIHDGVEFSTFWLNITDYGVPYGYSPSSPPSWIGSLPQSFLQIGKQNSISKEDLAFLISSQVNNLGSDDYKFTSTEDGIDTITVTTTDNLVTEEIETNTGSWLDVSTIQSGSESQPEISEIVVNSLPASTESGKGFTIYYGDVPYNIWVLVSIYGLVDYDTPPPDFGNSGNYYRWIIDATGLITTAITDLDDILNFIATDNFDTSDTLPQYENTNKIYIINKNVGASTSITLHDGDTAGIADTIFETSIIQAGNTTQPEITQVELLIDYDGYDEWDGCGFKTYDGTSASCFWFYITQYGYPSGYSPSSPPSWVGSLPQSWWVGSITRPKTKDEIALDISSLVGNMGSDIDYKFTSTEDGVDTIIVTTTDNLVTNNIVSHTGSWLSFSTIQSGSATQPEISEIVVNSSISESDNHTGFTIYSGDVPYNIYFENTYGGIDRATELPDFGNSGNYYMIAVSSSWSPSFYLSEISDLLNNIVTPSFTTINRFTPYIISDGLTIDVTGSEPEYDSIKLGYYDKYISDTRHIAKFDALNNLYFDFNNREQELILDNNLQVGGSITSGESIISGGSITSGESIICGGDLSVSNLTTLDTMIVSGLSNMETVILSGDLTVEGITILDDVTVQNLQVDVDLTVSGKVTDNLTIQDDLIVETDLTVDGIILPTESPTKDSKSVSAGSTYILPRGLYNISFESWGGGSSGSVYLEIKIGSTWRTVVSSGNSFTQVAGSSRGSFIMSDGVNTRIYNSTGSSYTYYYQKF